MKYILKFINYLFESKIQILKFFVVGISSTILDITTLILIKERLNYSPVLAVATNQIIVIAYNFLLNKYWSFNTKRLILKQFRRYAILVIINYLASIGMMYWFHDLLNINYKIVRISSIAVLFGFNFFMYKHWVYKEG